jgi:hypothetical protein
LQKVVEVCTVIMQPIITGGGPERWANPVLAKPVMLDAFGGGALDRNLASPPTTSFSNLVNPMENKT